MAVSHACKTQGKVEARTADVTRYYVNIIVLLQHNIYQFVCMLDPMLQQEYTLHDLWRRLMTGK